MAYILMIDDNPQSQQYIERIVRHRSAHEIGFAGSSSDAVDKIVERRPEVILLDLFIPGMDGIDFFKMLRDQSGGDLLTVQAASGVEMARA